jgi:hypothetical protein
MIACCPTDPLQEDAERLASNAAASTSSSSSSTLKDGDFASPQQRTLFSLFDSYADVFYAAKPYPGDPGWRPGQPDAAMDAVLLHLLNHCAKTADVIKKNNDKIKGLDAGEAAVGHHRCCTWPKVLSLLLACRRIVSLPLHHYCLNTFISRPHPPFCTPFAPFSPPL